MFKDKVEEIFDYGVEAYKEYPKENEIKFELDRVSFNAEKLFSLSDLLGTGTIEIEPETRYGGYCETCSYEYGVMVVTAKGVKF